MGCSFAAEPRLTSGGEVQSNYFTIHQSQLMKLWFGGSSFCSGQGYQEVYAQRERTRYMDTLDGKYQIEQLLGQGGMGAVYRATHLGTKRTVAVKVIHPELLTNQPLVDSKEEVSSNNEFVQRFRREAEAAGRLRHPNVVDVTDFGFAHTSRGPVAYLVMEYLDGCSLAEVLAEEGALPIGWAIDILEQVCSAVEEAHRAGIIHRDLKPDNIWLEPNRRGGYTVKVLDFGLVKLGEPDHSAVRGLTELTATEAGTSTRSTGAESTLRMAGAEAETLLRSASEEHQLLKIPGSTEGFEPLNSRIESNGRRSSDPSLGDHDLATLFEGTERGRRVAAGCE
jgi:serine/threonine protein kinase